MITVLASIIGFISSIIPEIIKYFKDINDKKHELKIISLKSELKKHTSQAEMEELHLSKDLLEQKNLYNSFSSGIAWVEALNSSVRPLLAYGFFIIYVAVKVLQYQSIKSYMPIFESLNMFWDIEDQAIFASIISFYFGQRTFKGIWSNKNYFSTK